MYFVGSQFYLSEYVGSIYTVEDYKIFEIFILKCLVNQKAVSESGFKSSSKHWLALLEGECKKFHSILAVFHCKVICEMTMRIYSNFKIGTILIIDQTGLHSHCYH